MNIALVKIESNGREECVLVRSNVAFDIFDYCAHESSAGIRATVLADFSEKEAFIDEAAEVLDLLAFSFRLVDDWRDDARIATLNHYGAEL